MKKHLQLLVLVAALLLPMLTQAQRVTIGTGTSTSYSPSPFCNYYNNGMSQILYLASDINASGMIDTLWFEAGSTNTVSCSNLHIYLATTSNTTLTSFLPASEFTEVYTQTGGTLGGNGWVAFPLSTPFYYDGGDNLVVCCTRQSSSYSSSVTWKYTSVSGSICYRQNDSYANYGLITDGTSGSSSTYRFNLRLNFNQNFVGPSCARPTSLTTQNLTSSSADVVWSDTNASISGFRLYYYPTDSISLMDSVDLTSTDTMYQFTTLNPDTRYTVILHTICDDYSLSNPRNLQFRTPCAEIPSTALPYVYGFEDASGSGTSGTISPCWTKGNIGAGSYPYPSTSSHSGSYAMYFYAYSSSVRSWLVMPLFEDSINTLQLQFWAKRSGSDYSGRVDVGVMTDPTDITTFTPVSHVAPATGSTNYEFFEVNLNNYTGTGRYIAFLVDYPTNYNASYAYNYVYIDDVTVQPLPTCLRVTDITTEALSTTEATISWRAGSTESEWLVDITPDSAGLYPMSVYDTTATFTGLSPETNYTITVQSVCGGGDSAQASSYSFYTGYCSPVFNYVDGDGITGVSFGVGDTVVNNSTYPTSSPYFGNYYNMVGQLPAGVDATVNITFGTWYNYHYVAWVDWNNNLTFEGNEVVGVGNVPGDDATEYSSFTFHISDTMPLGHYRMRIAASDSYYNSYTTVAAAAAANPCPNYSYGTVHDYTISVTEAPSCLPVADLQVHNVITTDSVYATWREAGTSTSWDLALLTTSVAPDSNYTPLTVYDTTYLFPALSADTTYYLYVRSNCGGETSTWSNVVSFRPGMYVLHQAVDTLYACSANIYDDGGPDGSYSPNANYTLVVYPTSPDSLIRVWGTWYSEGCCDYLGIYDGVGTSGTEFYHNYSGSLTNIGPFMSTSGPITITLTSDGSAQYAGFELHTSCVYLPSCSAPVSISADSVLGDTAWLSWVDTANSSSFAITYGPAGFNPDTATVNVVSGLTGNSHMLTGLAMGQLTDFYVRAECPSENSLWIGPASATPGYFYTMAATGTDTLRNACGYIITDNGGASGAYAASCNSTLVLLPNDSTQTLVVSGSTYTESCCDHLIVYDGIGTTGTVLFQHTSSMSGTVSFGPFISEEGAVTLKFTSDGSVQYDGFTVGVTCVAMSGCVRPNQVSINNVDDQSATISWNERGTATAWQIEYGPSGFTPGGTAGTIVPVFTNPATLTGLTPNTAYDAYVYSDCGTELSLGNMISFRTACVAIDSLPYFYGFEDANSTGTTGQINSCWKKYYYDGSSFTGTNYPYPAAIAATGTRSLYFYSYYDTPTYSYVVLPMFEDSLADLQITFKVRAGSMGGSYINKLDLGVMNNPDDLASFTLIDTYTATSNSSWDTYTVYLASYTGTGRYIAFKTTLPTGSYYYNYVYLDDITVDYAPDCGFVTDLTATPGISTAMLTWQPSDVGIYTGAEIEYRPTDSTSMSWMTQSVSNDTYAALTNLSPNTQYTARVAASCSGSLANAQSVQFTTRDFACVEVDTATSDTVMFSNSTSGMSGCLAYSSWGNTAYQTIWTASELIAAGLTAGSITAIDLGFTGCSNYNKEFTIWIANSNATSITSSTLVSPANHQLVYGPALHPTNTSGWQHYEFDQPFMWDGSSSIMITTTMNQYGSSQTSSSGLTGYYESASNKAAFRYQDSSPFTAANINSGNSGSTYSYRAAIHFYSVECAQQSTCAPAVAAVSNVTTNSVDLIWAPGNTETSWNVYYRRAGAASYTLAATTAATSYSFQNLNSGTAYEFRVVSLCSATDSMIAELEATTECAIISTLPFSENFNSWGVGTGVTPNCWSREGSYSTYGYISGSFNHSGATGGSWYTYGSSSVTYSTYLTFPELDTNIQINQTQVVFYAYNQSTSYNLDYEIGVMTSPSNTASFVNVASVHVSQVGNWQIFEVPLTSYNGNGRYLCIKSNGLAGYGYGYIDDVTLEYIPTCPRPDSLMASNATSTSVDVSWHERGGATDWIIEYGPVGFEPGTGVGTVVNANTNPYTLTNVPSSYDGDFYVRSICSSTDTGNYSYTPCRFSTSQLPASLPYAYNFEDSTEWANWQTATYGVADWYRGTADAADGNYSMYVSSDNGATVSNGGYTSTVNAAVFRDVDFGTVDSSFTFTFKAKVGGTTAAAYDGLMVFLVDPSIPAVASNAGITSPWGNVNNLYRIASVRLDTTWRTYTASFDTIHGVKRVAFFYFNQATSSYANIGAPAAVDSIVIDYSPCPRPVNLDVDTTTITSTSAMLQWDGPAAAQYRVCYRVYGAPASTNVYLNANTNSFTLTGLDPLTQYIAWVQKLCGADSSLFSDGVLFSTLMCDGAEMAYNYDPAWSATTSSYAPIGYALYNYSYTQTLIDSAQMAAITGDITAFAYNVQNLTANTYYTNCDVYMANVPETSLSSFIMPDTTNHVFVKVMDNATLNWTETGWNTFLFDTTFTWDGHSNVLFAVNRKHGTYTSSSTFSAHSTSGVKTLYIYNDGSAYDPTTVSGGTAGSYVGDLQLISCGATSCAAPGALQASATTYQDATVTWTGAGSSYEVSILQGGMWSTETAVTGTTHTFTGLQPATTYTFRVRQDCSADSLGVSDWATGSFTTDSMPCFAPTNFQVQSVTGNSATFGWTAADASHTAWEIRIYNTTFDSTYAVATNPATITGLQPGLPYNANIRTLCGDAHNIEGMWADSVITFTLAACPAVTGLDTVSVSFNQVVLSWTADPLAQSWVVEYGILGFNQGSGTTVTVTAPTATITGLTDELTYSFYVKTVCGTNWESDSWQSITVTTDEAPADVVNVTALANNNAWGTVTGGGSYAEGSTVTLTAIPAEHCEFLQWADGVTANPRTVVVNTDTTFIANFAQIPQYTITVDANDAEMGTVAGGGQYYRGETATLTATANEGYAFQYWNDGNTDNPRTITVTADAAYTAMFASDTAGPVVTYTVTLTVNDETMGTVTGAGTYVENSSVTIAAVANNGYRFVTWSDGNTDATRTFAITSDVTLEATFEQNQQEGIDDVNGALTCTVYPNPAHSTANISVSGVNGQVRIMLLDMSGRTVASETMECSADCVKLMDVDGLAAGTYFVRVVSEQASMVQKLIVR